MTVFACPTPEALPVATRGHYIAIAPEPTTAELLDRIAWRLLEPLPGEFNHRAELIRNATARHIRSLHAQARTAEQLASLAFPATDAFLAR